jgi:hypothetical protein
LKRQVAKLQRQVSHGGEHVPGKAAAQPGDETATRVRFTAKGLRSQRIRLGLSAGDFARLVGVVPSQFISGSWERRSPRGHLSVLASFVG